MKLLCIKDVWMDEGEHAFTDGQEYKGYFSTLKDNYTEQSVIRAKNNQKERHIIKYNLSDNLDEFFYSHFRLTE